MRLLLIIPVLVLFLSNVPFIKTMPLAKAIILLKEDETCGQQKCNKQNQNIEASCSAEESICTEGAEDTSAHQPGDNCCQKTETTCVCIYCFQFAAPIQAIAEFHFKSSLYSNNELLFTVGHVKDPYINVPWQPPDLVF